MGVLSNPVASTDIGRGNGLRAREGIKIRLLRHSNPMGDNVFYVGNFVVGNNRIFHKPIGAFRHSLLILDQGALGTFPATQRLLTSLRKSLAVIFNADGRRAALHGKMDGLKSGLPSSICLLRHSNPIGDSVFVEQNRILSAKPIQNGNHKDKPGMDRHPQNTHQTRGNASRTLGTARLVRAT